MQIKKFCVPIYLCVHLFKQAVEFSVDHSDNFSQILLAFAEIHVVNIHDQDLSCLVRCIPCFIPFIQTLEIIETNTVLIISSAFLNLFYQGWYTRSKINDKIGSLYEAFHQFKQREVVIVIA